ncbi:MAG: penicillin-binding protein 1C [Bacteroidetes bacterium GWA2_32_17]|nr:MAG: penicillin-binding protein 1C [Bacteroidetes bacterium GWA2_32_17]
MRKFERNLIILFILFIAFAYITKHFSGNLFNNPLSFVILDKDNNLLNAKIASDGQWRFPEIKEVPLKFKIAITTFEDKRFYLHNGVDIYALSRALYLNIKHNKIISGGSTITMQIARLSQKNKPRTIFQKTREIFLAWLIEIYYSKDEILSLYSSNAPYGGNVVGLQAASWRYFGRMPNELSWAESCMLAVLPNSPSLVHIGKNRNALKHKRDVLLNRLFMLGYINKETSNLSKEELIPDKPNDFPQEAPHLLDRIMKESNNNMHNIVKTTISEKLQNHAYLVLERYKPNLIGNGINNAAAIIMEVETGKVLAYIGNYNNLDDTKDGCQVDIINAPRSTGSILKPVLYASMLSSGEILPNTLVPDIPIQIGSYSPKNYSRGYDGAVPANRALAKSLNIPAVKMLQSYGVQRLIFMLQKLGLTTITRSENDYGLSLILGGCEAKLFEVAGMYASMARILNHYNDNNKYSKNDIHLPIFKFQKINNKVQNDKSSFINASAIWFTFQAMLDVDRPPEESNWQMFSSGRKIAWKTGTSFGFRDGWAIGINPKYVVGVWVGNADGEGRPELTGIKTAAPVLFDLFSLLPNENEWFNKPTSNMVKANICKKSGYLTSDICDDTEEMLIPANGINFKKCPYHKLIHLDKTEKFQVNTDCEEPSQIINKSWFVLPPTIEYYFKSKNNYYKTLPPFRVDCKEKLITNPNKVMEIIYPKNLTQIYIPKELDGKPGSAVFEVAHRKSDIVIYWYIDKKFICETKDLHQAALNPLPGKHILTLTDENGETLSIKFEVLDKEKK